ncbi:hypothetical protein FOPG_13165 [Fusarium oxysporum f. sp. conglutinans race 2 54008]|uniref:Metallo-beta-lactamase domain-containing protein n=1 Tax=Fusarium oxysporum f. sp. conglutinans race 2 54008 TaxID=1089457 RepID=X0H4R8_FUSOX|nr:hypothetical protein FOPG_13165 [Fusarium oxysporum f. sp. conglutinans race 2 54008]
MPTSLYDLIIPTFIKGLQTFDHVLTKAEQYAKEKGLNADEVFPQARLVDDQLPLVFQVQNATKAVQVTIGRLTGVEPTFFQDNEKTIADLHARIQKALEAVKSVKPEDVNSREDVKVELPRPDKTLHLTVKEATLYHGQTNFFFHIVTGYSILRSKGVPIGKGDYLGSFLAHAKSTIERVFAAIGEEGLSKLHKVTYECQRIYRSRSLMQSYNLMRADVSAATSGSQNISYEVDWPLIRQRIDRRVQPSHSWGWASPQLEPLEFSLVVQAGEDDFACFVKGNNEVFLPRNSTSGCVDLYSNLDKLLLIIDPETYLPYIIRTEEQHPIYGYATKDVYLSNYKEVQGIKFPHTIQTIYNSSSQRLGVVLEDFVIDKINATAEFPKDFFDPGSDGQNRIMQKKTPGVPSGLVTDYSTSLLGSPVKNVSVDALKSIRPVDLLQLYWLIIDDSHDLGFKQLIIEFENEVIVCDAPPFWSEAVMEWIKKTIGKKVTYVAPTHHHRDHSGGVADYVRAGAKLIIPEMAVDYWSSVPGAQFITFNQTHPYVHRDNKIQAWFNWADQAPHAADWTYVMVTEQCPNKDSPIFVFEADTWEAGLSVDLGNQQQMRQWLDQTLDDGLPRSATVMPTHGKITPLEQLINITAYPYPDFDISRWRKRAALCNESSVKKNKDD